MEESRKETGVAEAAPSLDTEEVADMRVKLEQPFTKLELSSTKLE